MNEFFGILDFNLLRKFQAKESIFQVDLKSSGKSGNLSFININWNFCHIIDSWLQCMEAIMIKLSI